MRSVDLPGLAALAVLVLGGAATHAAGPDASGRAARLSEALGGTLDSELGEAGGLAHAVDDSTIVIRPGRSVEYRRRVALEMQAGTRGHR